MYTNQNTIYLMLQKINYRGVFGVKTTCLNLVNIFIYPFKYINNLQINIKIVIIPKYCYRKKNFRKFPGTRLHMIC